MQTKPTTITDRICADVNLLLQANLLAKKTK